MTTGGDREGTLPEHVGAAALSRHIGVPVATIRLWARQGKLPARRAGSLILFSVTDVAAWLAGLPPATEDGGERQRRGAATRRQSGAS